MAPSLRHRSRVLTFCWALLRLLFLLPLTLFGLALLTLGLALSPWGTGLLLDTGERFGFYSLESHEGAPLERLVLRGLELNAGPADVSVSHLELSWADDCLLNGRLCLETLAVEGARIRLAAGAEAEEADNADPVEASMDDILLPLPIELRALALNDVEIALADGTRLHWASFTSGARAEASRVELLPTRLAGLRVYLPPSPGVQLALNEERSEATDSEPRITADAIDAATGVHAALPTTDTEVETESTTLLPLADQPRRTLPEIRLPLQLSAAELLIENAALEGAAAYAIDRLALTLSAQGHEVVIHPLEIASRDADMRLEAQLSLRDDYPLKARLSGVLWLPDQLPELAGQRIALALDGDLGDLLVDLALTGPLNVNAEARLDALDPTLPVSASLTSDLLQWPLPGAAQRDAEESSAEPWLVESVSLRAEGSLLDYRVAASLMAEGPELPYTRVSLVGSGDLEHFAWTPLAISLAGGSLVTHGRVDWAEALAVRATARLDRLEPGRFVEGLEGRLTGDLEASFRQGDEGWRVAVPQLSIAGELQSLPLSLEAQLEGDSEMRWSIETLDFRQGENRLTAAGSVSEEAIDLTGALEFPAMASLHESLSGTLSGRFSAAGSISAPRLDLTLSGDAIAFDEHRLESLRLSADISGEDIEDPALDVRLTAEGLEAAGQRLDRTVMELSGRLSAHRLTLNAQAAPGTSLNSASLTLEGGLDRDTDSYRGRLAPLEVDADQATLRLIETLDMTLDLAAGSARVEPFCLRREQGGTLCLNEPLQASADSGRADLSLRDLPMALLDPLLPETWTLDGGSELDLVAEWRQGGDAWRADLRLASELALEGLDAYGQSWSLPASRLTADVAATQARAELDLTLTLADAGQVALTLAIDDPLGSGELEGRLTLEALRLDRYRTLVAGMETLEGQMQGEVAIAGDMTAPALSGRLGLNGLRLSGVDIPMQVRDGEVTVELAGDQGRIDGFIAAEEGRLLIRGDAAWPSPDEWRIDIALDGREQPLLAVIPAFGRMRIAPDMTVAVTPSRLQVRGAVRVPWARLGVGTLPASAVSPSADERIITERDEERARREAERAAAQTEGEPGGDAAQALAQAGMAVSVRLELGLGPDMALSAHGLEANLAGTLEVRQQDGPVQLFGDVNLVDGRFRAYGQDLIIREGQLLFGGPPDQPLLSFEAIRNPEVTQDDVVAGLRVTGSAAEPQLSIFSEPAMDEARALSYLLRGRAPDGADNDGALTQALIGLTLGQTGGAVGAIGEAFGVSDLTLETAGSGEDSQLVVSGQLTDDLRVSYGVGVFSPIAELTLRYTLWRNLYVQAVSGVSQAVDLVYTFNRPGRPARFVEE